MSLFDFLAQDPNAAIDAGVAPAPPAPAPAPQQAALTPPPPAQLSPADGLLQQAPQAPQKPGLLARLRAPDDTGISTLDRIGAAAAMLRDNATPDAGYKILSDKQKAFQATQATAAAQALKTKGNQAFRAAYQSGKFDPSTYATMMGDDLDPEGFVKLATAAAPKGAMSGSFATATNPLSGNIDITGQRPPDYAENTAAANSAETQRHNSVTEAQGNIHAAVAQGQAALAKQREGRIAAKAAGGGADWTHRVIGQGKVQ